MPMIAVAGSIAQRPNRPGHAWVFLSYLLGFRQLGHEVLFVDRVASAGQARWLAETMEEMGLGDCYAALVDGGSETVGLARGELAARLGRCALLINVNGFLTDAELMGAPARRAYLDIDPGFAQIWRGAGPRRHLRRPRALHHRRQQRRRRRQPGPDRRPALDPDAAAGRARSLAGGRGRQRLHQRRQLAGAVRPAQPSRGVTTGCASTR